jgi:hypothetical protein
VLAYGSIERIKLALYLQHGAVERIELAALRHDEYGSQPVYDQSNKSTDERIQFRI